MLQSTGMDPQSHFYSQAGYGPAAGAAHYSTYGAQLDHLGLAPGMVSQLATLQQMGPGMQASRGLLPELADVCCLSKAASGSQAGSSGCPLQGDIRQHFTLKTTAPSQMQQPTIFACAACIVDQLPAPWGCCTSTCFVICSPASWLNCSAWGL